MPIIFYDTETTGTRTSFDQILQFAAIKTDEEFNILDTFNVRCRLLPYVVPARATFRNLSLCESPSAMDEIFGTDRPL